MAEGNKNDEGKLRFDLIPTRSLKGLAEVFTRGARKYSDRNWEKGFKWTRVYAALLRHLVAWYEGEDYDHEDGQHHLDSVAWCAFALREFGFTHPELDDRPKCLTSSSLSQWESFTSSSGPSINLDPDEMKGQIGNDNASLS